MMTHDTKKGGSPTTPEDQKSVPTRPDSKALRRSAGTYMAADITTAVPELPEQDDDRELRLHRAFLAQMQDLKNSMNGLSDTNLGKNMLEQRRNRVNLLGRVFYLVRVQIDDKAVLELVNSATTPAYVAWHTEASHIARAVGSEVVISAEPVTFVAATESCPEISDRPLVFDGDTTFEQLQITSIEREMPEIAEGAQLMARFNDR